MVSFSRIVAATDLSECSAAALMWAKAIARKFGAELTLLHVNTIAPLVEGVPGNLGYATAYQLEGARDAADHFAAKHLADVPAARKLVISGAAAETILATARKVNAELVVVGTRGATGIRALLGSVAESVIRGAEQPVLTIRCDLPGAAREAQLFRRILCPIQFGGSVSKSLAYAQFLASAFDAELFVVHVEEREQGVFDPEAEVARLRAAVADVPSTVRLKLLVSRGNPADQIVGYAKDNDADLLVVGARPKSVDAQRVLGSTTEKLARHVTCPVLTVPETTGAAEDETKTTSAAS